jgi:hypothetical protein
VSRLGAPVDLNTASDPEIVLAPWFFAGTSGRASPTKNDVHEHDSVSRHAFRQSPQILRTSDVRNYHMKRLILFGWLCWAAMAYGSQPVLQFNMTSQAGAPVTYVFAIPDNYAVAQPPVEDLHGKLQHEAGVNALTWAKQFYGARDVFLTGVDLKESPAPYFLAKFNGEVNGQRQEFFAVVLVNGTVVEPTKLVAAQ